jgi:LuxR family maltose regulon positive regulatory protein
VVRRPRLERRLEDGVRGPLTLVVAPAGTGKTVLAASWATHPPRAGTVVWLSLDEDGVRPGSFWRLLVTGMSGRGVVVPPSVPRVLDGGGTSFLFELADGLRAHAGPVALVLDCDAVLPVDVAAQLDGLLRRAAGGLRLVLLAREDPLLPLHRYRLAESVVELRMDDLAFTPDEAHQLLSGVGVDLSASAMDATMGRTRGWAAGLRMAAMSLAHREDRDEAARRFAGDTGTVAEYLLAEVLNTQAEGMRQLLLDTSVVDVLQPGLATALAGPHAERALSFLVHGNAFLEELPDRAGTYRYHDLFRELLRAQAAFEAPERAVELHRVAAAWLAEHGLVLEAVRHALATRDWESAARYAVDGLALPTLLTSSPHEALHDALATIPRSAEGTAVAVVGAARAFAAGDGKGAAARTTQAQELLAASGQASWPAGELAVAVLQLVQARRAGDADAALHAAAEAQRLLSIQEPEHLAARPEMAALVQANRGAALVLAGRPGEAAAAFTAATGEDDLPGGQPAVADALSQQALLAALRGDLTRSADLAARALPAQAAGPATAAGAAEVALAYVHTERYDVGAALQHAQRAAGDDVVANESLPAVVLALTRARMRRADGDVDGALSLLAEARDDERLPLWLADLLDLEQVDVLVATGQSERAADVTAQLSGPGARPGGPVLADGATRGWSTSSSPAPHRPARVDTLVRSATMHAQEGNEAPAVEDLEHALRLAAPELTRRPFRAAPESVWRLLRQHDELLERHSWLEDVHETAAAVDRIPRPRSSSPRRHVPAPPVPGLITEPLTEKEREVLSLLSELLSTQEIAATMFISINTVRTHVRNILRKLAASRRNEAVRRARDLGLISG